MDPYSNEELFLGIKNLDDKVLEYIILRFKPGVKTMIGKMGGTREDKNDYFHDGLLELIEKIRNNKITLSGNLQNILHVICSNNYKDRIRNKNAAGNYEVYVSTMIRNFEYVDPTDEMDKKLYKEAIHNSLQTLKEICIQIITKVMESVTFKEIAKIHDLNYDYTRRKYKECLEQLKIKALLYVGEKENE